MREQWQNSTTSPCWTSARKNIRNDRQQNPERRFQREGFRFVLLQRFFGREVVQRSGSEIRSRQGVARCGSGKRRKGEKTLHRRSVGVYRNRGEGSRACARTRTTHHRRRRYRIVRAGRYLQKSFPLHDHRKLCDLLHARRQDQTFCRTARDRGVQNHGARVVRSLRKVVHLVV